MGGRPESLGERIRRLREISALKSFELDAAAGLCTGHTSQLERRPGTGSFDTVAAIADVFGVTTDYLGRGRGPCPSNDEIALAVVRAKRGRKSRAA